MRKIGWVLIVFMLLLTTPVLAFETGGFDISLKPYFKGGTIAWDQLRGEGGHKSMIAGGG